MQKTVQSRMQVYTNESKNYLPLITALKRFPEESLGGRGSSSQLQLVVTLLFLCHPSNEMGPLDMADLSQEFF
jgi:hypothetical protein